MLVEAPQDKKQLYAYTGAARIRSGSSFCHVAARRTAAFCRLYQGSGPGGYGIAFAAFITTLPLDMEMHFIMENQICEKK